MTTYDYTAAPTLAAKESFSDAPGNEVTSPPTSNSTESGIKTGIKTETTGGESGSVSDDPVTKAVVDNIMGRLPTKATRPTLRCEICDLEFASQIPLDMHLKGSKHMKKVKSQEILKSLQAGGQIIQQDASKNLLSCEICNVIVNSSQQLQTHLSGSKHRQKLLKRSADSSESVGPAAKTQALEIKGDANEKPNGGVVGKAKKGDTKPGNLTCTTCNVSLNSEIQLQQHLSSKKHADRAAGKVKAKPKASWWLMNKKKSAGLKNAVLPPPSINESFVKAEPQD